MHSRQFSSLLKLASESDDGAYDEVIAAASERLHRLAARMLRGYPKLRRWEQTDDVVQNVSIRLYRSLKQVRPDSVARFTGLAATETRRALIDLTRHHFGPEGKAARHYSDASPLANSPVLNKPDPASKPQTLDDWSRFHEAIGELPDEERRVMELVWYSDWNRLRSLRFLEFLCVLCSVSGVWPS